MQKYEQGDQVRVTGTFTDPEVSPVNNPDPDSGEELIDPGTVLFCFRKPDGTTTTWTYGTDPQPTRDSLGIYKATIDADSAGVWNYRFYSTGTGKASEPGQFFVEGSPC